MVSWILAQRPEWLALTVNLTILSSYLWKWDEPGKMLYWAGACLLTVGLLLMKG